MQNREGYTLLELVLVVAIMGMIAAIVTPMAISMFADNDVEVAGDMIRMAWAEARGRAVDKTKSFKFAVQPGTGIFQVAPEDSENWNGPPSYPNGRVIDDGNVLVGELPKDILFNAGGGATGSWSGFITFLPDGTAQEDAMLTFGNKDSSYGTTLYLRGLTGAVTSTPPVAMTVEGGVP